MCDQVAVKVEEEEEGLEYATPTQRTTLKNPTDHSGVPDVADLSLRSPHSTFPILNLNTK